MAAERAAARLDPQRRHVNPRRALRSVAQRATLWAVIESFKHKGLSRFFETGSTAGVQANHARWLRMQLAALDTAQIINDMDLPGFNLHPLKGKRRRQWSISVSGNWRITFEFENGNAHIVNYEDYH